MVPDVARAARHQVADALSVVECLTLPEQAHVELVAGVALYPAGQHLGAQPREQIKATAQNHDREQRHSDHRQRPVAVAGIAGHRVEGPADQPGDRGVEHHHDQRTGQEAEQCPGVAQLVGEHPAGRATPVVAAPAGDRELGRLRRDDAIDGGLGHA
jgi:hypothetical protein